MDLKEISLPYKFGFPLSQAKSLANHRPRNYKKKTREINAKEKK
jgi:hypothetical protein